MRRRERSRRGEIRGLLSAARREDGVAADCLAAFLAGEEQGETETDYAKRMTGGVLVARGLANLERIATLMQRAWFKDG